MDASSIKHEAKVQQVATDYARKGYTVIVGPTKKELPPFVKNYQPDIIARSERDNVVIEVKTRSRFRTIEAISEVAEVINKQKTWRFELIVVGEKGSDKNDSDIDR